MIRLENVLKTSLQDILKMPWRRLQYALKTFWNCLEEVFPRRLEDVLKSSWRRLGKTSSRCLEDVFARRLEDVLKISWRCLGTTSWKRLENVMKMYDQDEYIGLDQNVLKTSSEDEDERRLQDVFKTSSSRRNFAGKVLDIPGFWLCLWFWICQDSECTRVLDMPGLHRV